MLPTDMRFNPQAVTKTEPPKEPEKKNNCRRNTTITLIVLGALALLAAMAFAIAAVAASMPALWIGSVTLIVTGVALLGATFCTAKNTRKNDYTFDRQKYLESHPYNKGTVIGPGDYVPGGTYGRHPFVV